MSDFQPKPYNNGPYPSVDGLTLDLSDHLHGQASQANQAAQAYNQPYVRPISAQAPTRTVRQVIADRMRHHQGEVERLTTLMARIEADPLNIDIKDLRDFV